MGNREQTRQKILLAVGELLAKDGFKKFGVNTLARQAGVDKVLIYRYFGGLPGLLRSFGESADFWPTLDEIANGNLQEFRHKPLGEAVGELLVNFARALRKRPLTREIMAWEMLEPNELTTILAETREEWAQRLFATFNARLTETDLDLTAISALLGAAINYLVIRGRNTQIFNLLEINSDAGWKRLEEGLLQLCRNCFAGPAVG